MNDTPGNHPSPLPYCRTQARLEEASASTSQASLVVAPIQLASAPAHSPALALVPTSQLVARSSTCCFSLTHACLPTHSLRLPRLTSSSESIYHFFPAFARLHACTLPLRPDAFAPGSPPAGLAVGLLERFLQVPRPLVRSSVWKTFSIFPVFFRPLFQGTHAANVALQVHTPHPHPPLTPLLRAPGKLSAQTSPSLQPPPPPPPPFTRPKEIVGADGGGKGKGKGMNMPLAKVESQI